MDDDALNMRNWGYYEPTFKGHLGLQLMTSMVERDTKPFMPGRDPNLMVVANAGFHPRDYVVSEASIPMNYVRDSCWMQRDKFFNMLPTNGPGGYGILPETSAGHHHPLQSLQPPSNASMGDERAMVRAEEVVDNKDGPLPKKRQARDANALKPPKPKKARKLKDTTKSPVQRVKPPKKSIDILLNGTKYDMSNLPSPVCSCTGTPQQCYRWGCGGWQSACCTTNVSMYPLPMSTKRRGARIAGRKMSQGAFKKVLEKVAGDGHDFNQPIDLRLFWAKHGTNKFVTIR